MVSVKMFHAHIGRLVSHQQPLTYDSIECGSVLKTGQFHSFSVHDL